MDQRSRRETFKVRTIEKDHQYGINLIVVDLTIGN